MGTENFQLHKLDLEKAEEPEIKLPTSTGSWKKQESSRKTSISALSTMPKPLTLWITMWSEVAQLCATLCDPWTVAYKPPPSMEFSRQEHWSGLPFPSPRDLPYQGIEPGFPALQTDTLRLSHQGSNSERNGNTRPPNRPLEKSVCRSGSNS